MSLQRTRRRTRRRLERDGEVVRAHEAETDDDPRRWTDYPHEIGEEDDGAGPRGRALVVAVVAIVDEVKHRAVQHLIVHDDGDDAQGARGDGGDERDDRESGDGDGEGDGGDEGGETVADVDPKAPRRVLHVRGIERGVLGEDNGPILERQRLGEGNVFK